MQIWSALGTSDGTGGQPPQTIERWGAPPLEVGELPQIICAMIATQDGRVGWNVAQNIVGDTGE